MVASRLLDHVGHELRSDRSPTFVLLVLPGVGEQWNDCRDSLCARNLAGMDHDAELHKRGVDGPAACVDNVDIVLSNGFTNGDSGFADSAAVNLRLSEGQANPGRPVNIDMHREVRGKRWYRLAIISASSGWLVPVQGVSAPLLPDWPPRGHGCSTYLRRA